MREALQTVQALIGQALDLIFALADFLRTSSVSLPVPAFVGVSIVAFLMGLILGRISKKGGSEALESSHQGRDDRVVLDLERLTPLGVSAEEEAEAKVMDISNLQAEETAEGTLQSDLGQAQQTKIAPQR
ncbi:MAG: hypothetical protein HY574_06170 [candidate division NC10 bacterium]|nr:hypothetical protein [candidate division NC10 bacterium]